MTKEVTRQSLIEYHEGDLRSVRYTLNKLGQKPEARGFIGHLRKKESDIVTAIAILRAAA